MIIAVIPVYNEVRTVRRIVDAVAPCVDQVVVVDDGSSDGTLATLEGASVEAIRHPVNRGKGEALRCGCARARQLGATAVITLDADGQHPPEQLPALLAAHAADPEAILVGARDRRSAAAPRTRRAANRVADFFISWAVGRRLLDTQSGFRLYPAAAVDVAVGTASDGFVYESATLMSVAERGFRVRYVTIPSIYDALQRPSHYRPVRDTARITVHVGGRLLRTGFSPRRLVRALAPAPRSE